MSLRVIGFNSAGAGGRGTSKLVIALLILMIGVSSFLSYGLYKEHQTNEAQAEQISKQNEQIAKIVKGVNNMASAVNSEFNLMDRRTRDLDSRLNKLED